jgi:acyl-CoA thioesterase II
VRPVLRELLDLLRLEPIEANLFRGQSQDLGWGAVYGGQVLGQALSAAAQTVRSDRLAHSLHGYFLRQGDARKPIVYQVDRLRDGNSFTSRRVLAIQGGEAILTLAASFQVADEGALEHQVPMPSGIAGPEGLPSELESAASWAHELPEPLRSMALVERPFEMRSASPLDPLHPPVQPAAREVWLRVPEPLPSDPALHRYLLAYVSDFHLLGTSLLPHGVSWATPGMQVASLDHAMWFHRPFRVDDWLLYVIDAPTVNGSRGLARGMVFDRQGQLVASTAQEGLVRKHGTPGRRA